MEFVLYFSFQGHVQVFLKRKLPELFNKLVALEAGRQSDAMYLFSDALYNKGSINFTQASNSLSSEFEVKKRVIHEFCNDYYAKNKSGMIDFIKKFNKNWSLIGPVVSAEFERLMQTKLPDFNVNITLTISSRCPFDLKANSFMLNYPSTLIIALWTVIHETIHLIYFNHLKVVQPVVGSDWWRLQEVIPDIILAELVKKPKFKPLKKFLRLPDYLENKYLLPVVYSYFKKHGFKKLITQIKKDPNYFLRLEHKGIKK